ncbi:MAG: methyltransferase [Myxococcaceae bacterium]
MSGVIREPRRPPGFVPVGPIPPGLASGMRPDDDEDVCRLAGEWSIFQKQRGHRWSLDDLLVAHLAAEEAGSPGRCLDLGCGVGSVLLMTAWRFPGARCDGIEAQEQSLALARKSIAWNGVGDRVTVRHGDLREAALESYDLVTGSPPYFPIGEGTLSERPQAPECRFEHRGGVEAYVEAASRALSPAGTFAIVASVKQADRLRATATEHGLHLHRWLDVCPREGKAPLIVLAVLRRTPATLATRTFTVRDASGQWTPELKRVRTAMGMPS